MNKITLLTRVMVMAIFFTFAFNSQVISGVIQLNENGQAELTISENTYSNLKFYNSVTELHHYVVKTKAGDFTLLNFDGYGYSTLIGDPKTPVLKKLIEVPVSAECKVNITGFDFVEIYLSDYGIENPVIPAQPSVSKSCDNPEELEFFYNQTTYAQDVYLDNEIVSIIDLGVMRGIKLARLEISPVEYNPVKHSIRVYTEIEVNIEFKGADVPTTIDNKESHFSPYFEGVYSLLMNYKSIDSEELIMDEPVTYIIVSDPMFESALQPFIEWKTKKGFYVIEGYTDDPNVGNTTTSIKNYLQDIYNNPPTGYNSQSFILFVGDVNQIERSNDQNKSKNKEYCPFFRLHHPVK